MASGNAGAGSSATALIDSTATFVSSGVAVGDCVLDDTQNIYGFVAAVVSETELTIENLHGKSIATGDRYRVVNASGSGAAVVFIPRCLDADWTEISEFVVLDGTNNVATANEYQRIYRMQVIHSGANQTNDGDITATAQIDATVTAQISAGNGQTLMAIYTVPRGKVAYMVGMYISANRPGSASQAMIGVELLARPNANIPYTPRQVKHSVGITIIGTSPYQHEFRPYKTFGEMTDIVIRVTSTTDDNMDVSAGFDIILRDK